MGTRTQRWDGEQAGGVRLSHCMCVRGRERERGRVGEQEREGERERYAAGEQSER